MQIIRKISIGPDPKDAMNFQVGTTVMRNFLIQEIIEREDHFDIFISSIEDTEDYRRDDLMLWKSPFKTMPIVIEYKIDF